MGGVGGPPSSEDEGCLELVPARGQRKLCFEIEPIVREDVGHILIAVAARHKGTQIGHTDQLVGVLSVGVLGVGRLCSRVDPHVVADDHSGLHNDGVVVRQTHEVSHMEFKLLVVNELFLNELLLQLDGFGVALLDELYAHPFATMLAV